MSHINININVNTLKPCTYVPDKITHKYTLQNFKTVKVYLKMAFSCLAQFILTTSKFGMT